VVTVVVVDVIVIAAVLWRGEVRKEQYERMALEG
jgi:hypothetical protein